jgi:hypothetical protein
MEEKLPESNIEKQQPLTEVSVPEASSASSKNSQLGSTDNHVFSSPETARHWQGIYEAAKYEGRHRFDPSMTWSAPAERRLKRKVITT